MPFSDGNVFSELVSAVEEYLSFGKRYLWLCLSDTHRVAL